MRPGERCPKCGNVDQRLVTIDTDTGERECGLCEYAWHGPPVAVEWIPPPPRPRSRPPAVVRRNHLAEVDAAVGEALRQLREDERAPYVSVRTVAARAGMNHMTTFRSLRRLAARGVVEQVHPHGGAWEWRGEREAQATAQGG